jgi:hypothetical protein
MKERRSKPKWSKETAGLGIKNQVIIIRIKTGYTRVISLRNAISPTALSLILN